MEYVIGVIAFGFTEALGKSRFGEDLNACRRETTRQRRPHPSYLPTSP